MTAHNDQPRIDPIALLDEARTFHQQVDECYEVSGYKASYGLNEFGGDENMAVMRRVIDESLDAQDAIHRIQRTWLFSVNISDAVKEKAVDWHLADCRFRYKSHPFPSRATMSSDTDATSTPTSCGP